MGHRLSKIVTRTGDGGETGLADGSRLPKSALRIHAIGEVDELNCTLGLLLVQSMPEALHTPLARCQHELFDLGGELSMPGFSLISEAHLERLDAQIEQLNADVPPLKEFVLPGGTPASAFAHLARATARRAERALWALHAQEPLNLLVPQYLNRLSDYLFVLSRVLARLDGGQEVTWKKDGAR
jgi:cob(I)alamin adenosyltransferase